MNRYGEKATVEALRNNYKIRYNDWYTLNAGYRVIDTNGEMVGYITQDLFTKLLQNRVIHMVGGGYSYKDYMLDPLER